MDTNSPYPSPSTAPSLWERNRLLIKGFLIAFLVLLMLVPTSFINNLIHEREARQQQVSEEINSKWAGSQTVAGPVLIVPYMYTYRAADGKAGTGRQWAHFLPDELKIQGTVDPQVRKRSLYEVTLYQAGLQLTGRFRPLQAGALPGDAQQLLWNEARLLVGVDDVRGLQDEAALQWNGAAATFESGTGADAAIPAGLSAPVVVNAATDATFSISLHLKGSGQLSFAPLGRSTDVVLNSPWPHPSFNGASLPDTGAAIGKAGFTAHWKTNSRLPRVWKDEKTDIKSEAFGVRLIQPADGYAKTERSVKYSMLFISLTFLVFFLMEIIGQKQQVHPLQYILVGFALCIFYTLLLSLSEYFGFNPAYLIAAVATVSLIGSYAGSIFRSVKTGAGFGAALGGLYGYIYILLQLEDYALLFGSIGLFFILATLMYFSRKIDWYKVRRMHSNTDIAATDVR